MTTNFLDAAGTNGFVQTQFNLMTTELNGLLSGAAVTSNSILSQSSWSNAIWAGLYFKSGGPATPTAGGYLAGWFLLSPDGGTTFESNIATPSATQPALARAPDFVIPAYEGGNALANGSLLTCQGRFVKAPWESHKILLQNLTGANLSTSGSVLSGTGMAIQY